MTARQAHGFKFEKAMIVEHRLAPAPRGAHKWDGFAPQTGLPVSVKTRAHRQALGMGDFFRQGQVDSDFYICAGFWKDKYNNIIQKNIVKIPVDVWRPLFPSFLDEEIKNVLKRSSPSYDYDQQWEQDRNMLSDAWEASSGSYIKLAPKRAHSTNQIRMQCVLPYESFLMLAEQFTVPDIL